MYIETQLEELLRGLLPADDGTYRDGAFYDAAAALHYWTERGPALLMDVERTALIDCLLGLARVLHAIRAPAHDDAPLPPAARARPVARKLSMADREAAIRQAIGAPT